jgi:hypothetical protein
MIKCQKNNTGISSGAKWKYVFMGKMKIRLKTILIIFGAIIALPLLGYIGLCVKAYYLNMNPDHVDLQKGGWVKLMHFTTDTRTDKRKTLVEIYGKSINKPNAGNFLIVRPGLLPFGITAISPIYNANHLWRKNYLFLNANTTTIIKGAGIENGATIIDTVHDFSLCIGYYYIEQVSISKYKIYPSVCLSLYYQPKDNAYHLNSLEYTNTDKIHPIKIPQSKFGNYPIYSEKLSGFTFDYDIKSLIPFDFKEEK